MGMMHWLQHPVARRAAGAHRSSVLRWLMGLGGVGLFGVSVIDSSVIPLPLPGSTDLLLLLLTSHGANPWLMAALSIWGSLLGGYFTWQAGRKGGEPMLKRYVPRRFLKGVTKWVEHNGPLSLGVSAMLPPPLPLLPFLLAAGAFGVTKKQFFWSFGVARTLRYGLVAWLGATYGRTVVQLWSRYLKNWSGIILWTYLGLLAAGILYGLWRYFRERRTARTAVREGVQNVA